MDRSQVCLADLRLNSTGNNRFYRSLFEEHIQALNIKSEPSGENVGMVVYPELSPYILQDWIASIVNNSTIFTQKKEFAVKDVIIYIIHERSCSVIWIDLLLHLHSICTRERNALRVMDFDDFTHCTYAPTIRKIILYAIWEVLLIKGLRLIK